jgi:hypothetical protein
VDEAIPWEHVHVDAIGVGKGVTERLAQRGIFVDKVDFGSKPKKDWRALTGKVAFANRRAELHWVLRRAAEEGLFSINREAFPDAWRQAQWAIYEYRHQGGTVVILIMPKKDIRKSYKRSPDHWDAVLLSYSRTGSRRLRIR